MATLYVPGETPKEVLPLDGKKFTLEEMQKYVGGYVEVHSLFKGQKFAMNEDGLSLNLPHNVTATAILTEMRPDLWVKRVVGPVVKYKRGEF